MSMRTRRRTRCRAVVFNEGHGERRSPDAIDSHSSARPRAQYYIVLSPKHSIPVSHIVPLELDLVASLCLYWSSSADNRVSRLGSLCNTDHVVDN